MTSTSCEPTSDRPPAAALIVMSAFLLLLAAAIPVWALGGFRSHAWQPALPATWSSLRDGTWTRALERHLQESSWLTAQLRGIYVENAFRLGVLDSPEVVIARDWWLFVRSTLYEADRFDRVAARRRAFLAALRRRVDALGLRLLVVLVPDKVRLHPEHLFAAGVLPPGKARLYPAAVAELRSAGFEVVAALDAILELRRAEPAVQPYYAYDAHWQVEAASHVALAVREHLDARQWLADLGPPYPYEPSPLQSLRRPGDLVTVLGIRHGSALADRLSEDHRSFVLALAGNRPFVPDQPEAPVALCGTSFSNVHFRFALAAALGVLVDHSGVQPGGGPFTGLLRLLDAVAAGRKRPRLVVWEFVERTLTDQWVRAIPPMR